MRRRRPLRQATGSPPDDLSRFIDDQYARVQGALTLFTGDPALAEDLTQEAFIRLCQRWEQVRAMDAPGAWIHRVAINLAHSSGRRRGAEKRATDRHDALAGPANDRIHEPDPTSAIHDRVDVAAAVLALARPERAVVVLRFYADLSVDTTATVLGIPTGTVKTRTRRAIDALRAAGIRMEVMIDE